MSLVQLLNSDGSYNRLKTGWRQQCEDVGEDFDLYAQGTFLVLDQLAAKPEERAGIFAVQKGDDLAAVICQANCTPLPGHPEPVLRVRMVTVSPELDFGTLATTVYIDCLVDLFFGIIELSQGVMIAREIKLHLRSPEDFNFFRAVRGSLAKISRFESVEMRGAWLYVTRAP
ncbi:MAG TPA: hypothetical protein VNQ56_16745 [Pseudolabrys sp.]|nr:hypothetical protein [Pseudolabrys sp.]